MGSIYVMKYNMLVKTTGQKEKIQNNLLCIKTTDFFNNRVSDATIFYDCVTMWLIFVLPYSNPWQPAAASLEKGRSAQLEEPVMLTLYPIDR